MGQCKLEGFMVSHPVHSYITLHIIELHVWNIIVCLVMHRITCLEYERMDFVFMKYLQCPMHQKGYHGHHRIAFEDFGDKSSTLRQNGTWIYANHHDPYILTVHCGLPNHWIYCIGDIEFSSFFGAPPQGGIHTIHQRRRI